MRYFHTRRRGADVCAVLAVLGVVAIAGVSTVFVGSASSARAVLARSPRHRARTIRVRVRPRVVEYEPARVSVSGLSAAAVSVRLLGANDPAGLAYHWNPYRWHRLRLVGAKWRGAMPAPPLRGIYRLQFQVQQSKRLLQSPHWLLRVLPHGVLTRSGFRTPRAVIRDFVSALPGHRVLVAARHWPQAGFDHRDPRLHQLFVIAYAPRRDNTPRARRGLFITTVRDGYHGRWFLLDATTVPYGGRTLGSASVQMLGDPSWVAAGHGVLHSRTHRHL